MLPADAKKMDTYMEAVVQTWTKADKSKRPDPKDLAAQWGLPVVQAVDPSRYQQQQRGKCATKQLD